MCCKDPGNPFIAHFMFLKNTWAAIQNVFLNFREQQYFEDVRILSSPSKVIKPLPRALQIKTESETLKQKFVKKKKRKKRSGVKSHPLKANEMVF